MDPLGDHERRVGVAQVMKADLSQSRPKLWKARSHNWGTLLGDIHLGTKQAHRRW